MRKFLVLVSLLSVSSAHSVVWPGRKVSWTVGSTYCSAVPNFDLSSGGLAANVRITNPSSVSQTVKLVINLQYTRKDTNASQTDTLTSGAVGISAGGTWGTGQLSAYGAIGCVGYVNAWGTVEVADTTTPASGADVGYIIATGSLYKTEQAFTLVSSGTPFVSAWNVGNYIFSGHTEPFTINGGLPF